MGSCVTIEAASDGLWVIQATWLCSCHCALQVVYGFTMLYVALLYTWTKCEVRIARNGLCLMVIL